MGILDCCTAIEKSQFDDTNPSATYECDYDKNPTSLYEAMENKAWIPTLEFFETGEWKDGGLFGPLKDPLPAERQARTWVTRFEEGEDGEEGDVRWSQLPLHAALIFGAPFKIILTLVTLYPQGVRCTDDQHMLPLHLAMKFGADDSVVRLLLEQFPESLFTKEIQGRYPTQLDGPNQDRTIIMDEIVTVTTKTLQKKNNVQLHDSIADMKDELVLQNKLNAELESQQKELDTKYRKSQTELGVLQNELKDLQKRLSEAPKVVPVKAITTKQRDSREPTGVRAVKGTASPPSVGTSSKKQESRSTKSFAFGSSKHKEVYPNPYAGELVSRVEPEHAKSKATKTTTATKTKKTRTKTKTKTKTKRDPEASNARSIENPEQDVSASKEQIKSGQGVSRRGFFKGFGAKE